MVDSAAESDNVEVEKKNFNSDFSETYFTPKLQSSVWITSVLLWWEDLYLDTNAFRIRNIIITIHILHMYSYKSPDKDEEYEAKSNISNIAEEMVEVSKCLNLGFKKSWFCLHIKNLSSREKCVCSLVWHTGSCKSKGLDFLSSTILARSSVQAVMKKLHLSISHWLIPGVKGSHRKHPLRAQARCTCQSSEIVSRHFVISDCNLLEIQFWLHL